MIHRINCGDKNVYGESAVYSPHKLRIMHQYIHEYSNWTSFNWDEKLVMKELVETRYAQGRLLGKMHNLGFDLQHEAILNTLTSEITKSSEIEGEFLAVDQVRSSIARRLGIPLAGAVEAERLIDGIVEMMLDATHGYEKPLNAERLFGWHAALFPSGWSHLYKITVADWRKDSKGPMQVVSGAMGNETVHFQAPAANRIEEEMQTFLKWYNSKQDIDYVLKAAIAHFWFVTIHPFEDGNGRITRAITEMTLAQSDESPLRFYSMSSQIRLERKQYYLELEKAQRGGTDITAWLIWFLTCLRRAIIASDQTLVLIFKKDEFWKQHASTLLNERQQKIINKLLDGFEGKLTTTKWAKISNASTDTALRDIQDLIKKNILIKQDGGGKNTSYALVEL